MEINALKWIHETFHSQAWLNYLMEVITYLGEFGATVIATALVLFLIAKTRRAGFDMICGILLCILIVNIILKFSVNRARPWTKAEEFGDFYKEFGIRQPTDSSFPSGHAAITFCGAVSLLFSYKAKAVPAIVVAFLVALSRVYLCLHYPTDVVGGMLIGSACGVGGHYASKALYPYMEKLLALLKAKLTKKKAAPAAEESEAAPPAEDAPSEESGNAPAETPTDPESNPQGGTDDAESV